MRATNRVEVRIFSPDNKQKLLVLRQRCEKGKIFTETGIESVLSQVAEKLDNKVPDHHYRCVAIRKDVFNFVWDKDFPLTAEENLTFLAAFHGKPECQKQEQGLSVAQTV